IQRTNDPKRNAYPCSLYKSNGNRPGITLLRLERSSLIEKTEAHILIGLFLLLLLLLSLLLSGSSTTGSGGSTSGSTTSTTRWDGSKLLGSLRDQLSFR